MLSSALFSILNVSSNTVEHQTYIQNRIKQLLSEMTSSFSDLQDRYEIRSYSQTEEMSSEEEEIVSMIKNGFIINAKSVYKLICNYLKVLAN